MPDDHELVKQIKNGNEPALETLTKRYYNTIFSFVYLKVGNKDLSYDLTQEVFIKMIKNINSYSKKGKFKNWLFSIANNHCRDHWKNRVNQFNSNQLELPPNLPNKDSDISYIFEKKETQKWIKSAIDSLPELQKEVVLLKYYHDLKIREIAYITASNESTVKTRLRQGLQKLQIVLKGEEPYEKKYINK